MVGAGDFKISALGWDFYGFILGNIIYISEKTNETNESEAWYIQEEDSMMDNQYMYIYIYIYIHRTSYIYMILYGVYHIYILLMLWAFRGAVNFLSGIFERFRRDPVQVLVMM